LDAHNPRKAAIKTALIDGGTIVAIIGSPAAFRFLRDVFAALAESRSGDIQFSPDGAGSAWLKRTSEVGLYLEVRARR
jgi:hypothetical protein